MARVRLNPPAWQSRSPPVRSMRQRHSIDPLATFCGAIDFTNSPTAHMVLALINFDLGPSIAKLAYGQYWPYLHTTLYDTMSNALLVIFSASFSGALPHALISFRPNSIRCVYIRVYALALFTVRHIFDWSFLQADWVIKRVNESHVSKNDILCILYLSGLTVDDRMQRDEKESNWLLFVSLPLNILSPYIWQKSYMET